MKRRCARGLAALAVGALSLLAPGAIRSAGAADAPPQLVPIETLLPLLQQLQPVFEIVSPIVWPACSNAVLVNVLPGAVGLALPPQAAIVTGPLLIICGSVPQPGTQSRKCGIDAQVEDALAKVTKAAAGLALPVEIAPAKWVTGFLDNIVDKTPLKAIPIGSTVAGVLQCADPVKGATTTTAPGAATSTPPAADDSALDNPSIVLPTFEDLMTLPPVDQSLIAQPVVPIAAEPSPVRFISQPKFRYPIVMGLPLVFVALLVFFGRALTRPLDGGSR